MSIIENKTVFTVLKNFLSTKEYNDLHKQLMRSGGISSLLYDFNTSILKIEYNPYEADTASLEKTLLNAGQAPLAFGDVVSAHSFALKNIDSWIKARLINLIAVALFSVVVLAAAKTGLSQYTVLAISGVLIYVLLFRVHKSVWKYFSVFKLDIYTLFTFAVTVGFVYSTLVMVAPNLFKAPGTELLWKQLTFMSLVFSAGMFIRNLEKLNARKRIINLFKMRPRFATLAKDDASKIIPVSDLQADELVVVRKGQMVPCDGIVTEGVARVDGSNLFRDSASITRGVGNKVHCGCKVIEGRIIVQSVSTCDNTVLSHYIERALELSIGHRNDKFYGNKPLYPFLLLNAALAVVAVLLLIKIGGSANFKAAGFTVVSVCLMLFTGAALYANAITQWFTNWGLSKYFKVHLAAGSSIQKINTLVINDNFVSEYDKEVLKNLVAVLVKRGVKTVFVSYLSEAETEKTAAFLGIERYYANFDTKRLLDLYAALKAEGNSLIAFANIYKEISLIKNVDFVLSTDKSAKLAEYFADAHLASDKDFLVAFLNIRKAYRIAKQNSWICYIAYFAVICMSVEAYISSGITFYLVGSVYLGFVAAVFFMLLNVFRMKRVLKS